MRKLLSMFLVLAMCFCLGTTAFASGEAGSGGMGGSSNLAGMLSLKSYVVENDGSDTVSFDVYGILKAGSESDAAAFVVDDAADLGALTFTVYADRDMTAVAEGVTAAYADGVLTLTGVATDANTAYYIGSDYPAESLAVTVLYVVNDQYDASVDYDLADGTTIALSEYAPGVASQSSSSIYIGANTTLLTADDYGITDAADAAIANWWLGSGVTNAGSTLTDFGDTFYRFELSVSLYRLFQIVIDEDTTVASNGGEFTDPSDSVGTMGSNDQYSDSVSATIYAGVWDGIYTTMNKDGYLENIPGVTEFGASQPVDEETLFVTVYNAFVSPWATLNDDGQAIAAGLNATTSSEKVDQIKAALGLEDWAIANYSTQKLAVLDVLKTVDAFVAPMTSPNADIQAAALAAGYAVVNDATADIASLIEQLSAQVITEDTEITGEDISTEYPTALFVESGRVTITDSTVVSAGSNTVAGVTGQTAEELLGVISGSPSVSEIGYNMTVANAFYRNGFGADLVAWGADTIVELTTTTGNLVISAPSNGSMAGGLYNGYGASILVHNAIAFSGGQHLSNTLYNGTIHYIDAAAIGGGRMYSSDFWGGNIVLENTVAAGGDVTDEPTTMICKNSVFKGTGSINGYGVMYFENALIEGGNFGTQNNTSLVSDAATVTLVNSRMDGSYLLSVGRSSRVIATLVDSELNLSGSTLATLNNSSYGVGRLTDDFTDMFQTEAIIRTYGVNGITFDGDTLEVNVGADQSLTLYVSDIIGGDIVNVGEGSFEIVYDDAYGVLYLNSDYDAPTHGAAEAAVEETAAAADGDMPAGFDESMNAGLDADNYPHFAEYQDYVAEYALADSFMSGQSGIPEDIYAAASPYIAPFSDINSVIGAQDYADWMGANYPGEAFPAE